MVASIGVWLFSNIPLQCGYQNYNVLEQALRFLSDSRQSPDTPAHRPLTVNSV